MKIQLFNAKFDFLRFLRFLDFWGPEGGAAGARKRSPRYQRGTIINHANAIPQLAFRTLSHHVHCQRYPTTTLSTLSHIANAIAPATLSTLSHHPHCQRCPTSHIANTTPSPALLNLSHPHCQIPSRRIYIAKLPK